MLQQSSTFRPFMQKFSAFAFIAMRASDYDIARPIRSAFGDWDYVIGVISVTEFLVAIVAFAALSFVLRLNIFGCVIPLGTTSSGQLCANIVRMLFVPSSHVVVSLTSSAVSPTLVSRPLFIFVGVIVIAYTLAVVFDMLTSPFTILLTALGAIILFVLATVFKFMVSILWTALPTIFKMTSLAPTAQAVSVSIDKKACEIGEQVGIAFGATLEGVRNIQHGNLLKLLLVLGGPELGNSVVRRVIKPSQALPYYTTEGGCYAV